MGYGNKRNINVRMTEITHKLQVINFKNKLRENNVSFLYLLNGTNKPVCTTTYCCFWNNKIKCRAFECGNRHFGKIQVLEN